ncbi:general odorant-binding protein 28a-like [Contarinia nasturtii]|uniref:general odorant-binding protein 28a-like n=1 Tax=Contarinia nasturtii TaxID=265458 RepID=UPI0012D3ECE8|nr:general odorant-binding protein 28a-like [Contarinia nasturtii]
MKVHAVFVSILIGLFSVSCNAELSEEMRILLKEKVDKCKTMEELSDVDVSRFFNGDAPETLKGKCLISCLQESVGLIKDGQVQSAAGFELGKMLFGDNENVLSMIKNVQDECATITDPDRCEMAFKRMSCAKETVQKHGLTPPREMI